MAAKPKRLKKLRLSPLEQLSVILLIILLLIFALAKCITTNRDTPSASVVSTVKPVKVNDVAADKTANYVKYAKRTADTKKLSISSKYGILINLDNNVIIAEKNSDKVIYPASLTKIMTILVAVENIKDLDAKYTYTAELIDPLVEEEASRAGFEPGEAVTLEDMLYGAALPSGADATIGLADYISGSEDKFVDLMNEKVAELGLKHTHFMNTSGLHDKNHYTTVHELALILKTAMKNETCAKILSTYTYTTGKTEYHPDGIELYSTIFSRMYGNEAKGVKIVAGKTGYTTEGGNCLASYAENKYGNKYILVTTGAKGQYKPIYDAIKTYAKYVGTGKTTLTEEAGGQ